MNQAEFDIAVTNFVREAQKVVEKNNEEFPLSAADLTARYGKRYVKIIKKERLGPQSFVYCFIDMLNGDVLKAAGANAPAKGKRSNIFDADHGVSGVTCYGARYLK